MNKATRFGLLIHVPLFEMEPILDQIDLNEIGMLESMAQLYSVEPVFESIVFDPKTEPEPLPEVEVDMI